MLWMVTDDTVTPMAITDDPAAPGLFNVFRYDRRFCSTGHSLSNSVGGWVKRALLELVCGQSLSMFVGLREPLADPLEPSRGHQYYK